METQLSNDEKNRLYYNTTIHLMNALKEIQPLNCIDIQHKLIEISNELLNKLKDNVANPNCTVHLSKQDDKPNCLSHSQRQQIAPNLDDKTESEIMDIMSKVSKKIKKNDTK